MFERKGILFMTQAAAIAAIYVVLTFVFAPISFGEVQVRISEALCILPIFTPAAIPGLYIGCFLGNLLSGASVFDVIFGSLATLIGAFGTYYLRYKKPVVAAIPPILSNAFIVPFILRYAYQVALPIWIMMLSVGAGEVLSVAGLGLLLYAVLEPNKKVVFRQ
ncbi:MAG: QueT transporter family protein [Lachnospiraceae bacterium]|nr:QueT transporter family protein [Lachnospiraceae bacterium]